MMFSNFADFADLEAHQHKTDTLVRATLKGIGRELRIPYRDVLEDFRGGNADLTMLFWSRIDAAHPGEYNRVNYCHGCRKFNLYRVLDS